MTEKDGMPVACAAFGLVDPVHGTLHGKPADPLEPVWIVASDGRRLSVVWPAGFTVRFEPDAVLRDDKSVVVARENGQVELSQVRWEEHAGTFDDPYLAARGLLNGCYVPGT